MEANNSAKNNHKVLLKKSVQNWLSQYTIIIFNFSQWKGFHIKGKKKKHPFFSWDPKMLLLCSQEANASQNLSSQDAQQDGSHSKLLIKGAQLSAQCSVISQFPNVPKKCILRRGTQASSWREPLKA